MSEESAGIGLVILAIVSVSCAVIAHWRIRDYSRASLASMLAAAVLFQGFVLLRLGYMDPLIVIAFPVSLFITGPITLLVGVPFRARRLKTTA